MAPDCFLFSKLPVMWNSSWTIKTAVGTTSWWFVIRTCRGCTLNQNVSNTSKFLCYHFHDWYELKFNTKLFIRILIKGICFWEMESNQYIWFKILVTNQFITHQWYVYQNIRGSCLIYSYICIGHLLSQGQKRKSL